MPPRMGNLQMLLRGRVQGLGAAIHANRFWFTTVSITLLLMGASFLIGHAALARSQALQQEEERLEGALERVDDWIRDYRAAAPPETVVWRRSEEVLTELGGDLSEPAAVVSLLTERAEALGISDLRIGFAAPDTATAATAGSAETAAPDAAAPDAATPPAPRSVGEWTMAVEPPAVSVTFNSDFATVLAFVDALPPHIEVANISLARREAGVFAQFVLHTFRPKRGAP